MDLKNEELVSSLKKTIQEYYDLFKSQRKPYETIWKVADYMVRCAQNKTIAAEENERGINKQYSEDANLANTGSTLFYRQYKQLAAQGIMSLFSSDMPFKYVPTENDAVFESGLDADARAKQYTALAKWTMRKDKFFLKGCQFWHQLRKYGNCPIKIEQHVKKGDIKYRKPVIKGYAADEKPIISHQTISKKNVTKENHPSLTILPIESVYADVTIPTLQEQDCVVIESFQTYSSILANTEYDKEQLKKINKTMAWDKTTGADHKREQNENQILESNPVRETETFPVRDVYIRLRIDGDEIKDEIEEGEIIEPKLHVVTIVGNDIQRGVVVRVDEVVDPDGEINVYMIKGNEDDGDMLYAMSESEVVRSNYSVETSLKNMLIDNCHEIVNRPMLELEGAVRGTDRRYKPGARFVVDNMNAIREMDVQSIVNQLLPVIQYINQDSKEALMTTNNMLGEAYGGRTSALEAGNAFRSSLQPHIAGIRYVLNQLLTIYALKIKRYWEEFAVDGQVAMITEEDQQFPLYIQTLYGDMDVDVTVIDELEQDELEKAKINEALNLFSQNEALGQYIDIPELLKIWFQRRKMPKQLVNADLWADSRRMARIENQIMMVDGRQVTIEPGENLQAHLKEHMAERLKYKGVEQETPNIVILDNHIAETQGALGQGLTAGGGGAMQQLPSEENPIGQMMGPMMGGPQEGAQMV